MHEPNSTAYYRTLAGDHDYKLSFEAQPGGTGLTDSDCVAVAWGLNNAFKHQVLGAGRRVGSGHLVSWCVLARAVMFLGTLNNEMSF